VPTVSKLPSARQAIHGLHQNDAVAAIQVLRRAGIITSDQCPDALLSVLRAKLVPWTHADTAMYMLGITKGQMNEARYRASRIPELVDYPSTKDAAEPRPKGERIPYPRDPLSNLRKAKPPTRTRPVSEDGDLLCTRCGKWLSPDNFKLRTDRIGSGGRRSACDPCHNAANRSRYLSVEAKASLNAVGLTFTIQDGDDAATLSCAACGMRLEVGDEVRTEHDSPIRHITCPKE
jgi:hypothetical protein